MNEDDQSLDTGLDASSGAPVSGSAEAPAIDSASGDAVPLESALAPAGDDLSAQAFASVDRAWELLSAGGPVVTLLLLLSVFTVALILAKTVQFAALRPGSNALDRIARLYRDGRGGEALALARKKLAADRAPVLAALEGQRDRRPAAAVADDARRLAAEEIETLGGWMRPLEVIAALAPLLGLFGTVLGMIEAFAELEAAGSNVDPSILSGGIWQALLTTAVGLAVAMPAVIAFNWFDRKIERVEHRLESALSVLLSEPEPMSERQPETARLEPAVGGSRLGVARSYG